MLKVSAHLASLLEPSAWRIVTGDIKQTRLATWSEGTGWAVLPALRVAKTNVWIEAQPKAVASNEGLAVTRDDGNERKRTMSTDQAIEAEIQAKGLTAARITPHDVESAIASEHYFTAAQGDLKAQEDAAFATGARDCVQARPTPQPLGLLTFCVLVLRNGFTVTGESACASPENFDADVGKKIARTNAVNKVWPLLGYQLRSMLARKAEAEAVRGAG